MRISVAMAVRNGERFLQPLLDSLAAQTTPPAELVVSEDASEDGTARLIEAFGKQFDYGIAHSVFTHLPVNSILVCLLNVERVLAPEGRFYATFFENPAGTKQLGAIPQPRSDGPPRESFPDRDPYHYGVDLFEWLCDGIGLAVEYLGEWGNPRSQKMLVFTRSNS